MLLFNMTEAQLGRAVEAHYDRMLDDNEIEPCCELCMHYIDGVCTIAENNLSEEDYDRMEESADYSIIERDPEDWCDDFEMNDKYEEEEYD